MTSDSLWTGLRASSIRVVATYWIRFSVRTGGGLVTLLLILLVGLSVSAVFIAPVETMLKLPGSSGSSGASTVAALAESEAFVEVVEWVSGEDEGQVRYLLRDQPAVLSVIFLALMWFLPFIACVGSFNQTAGDIGSRGLRYLLLRTERPNVLLGRFVGTVVASLAALFFLLAMILLYVGLKLRVYGAGEVMGWGVQGYLAMALLVVPYVALCTWVSCLFDSAFAAFALSLTFAGAPILLLKYANAVFQADLAWTQRLLPWGWKYDLLSGDLTTRLVAYTVMLGFTALFLLLALRHFHKRDL